MTYPNLGLDFVGHGPCRYRHGDALPRSAVWRRRAAGRWWFRWRRIWRRPTNAWRWGIRRRATYPRGRCSDHASHRDRSFVNRSCVSRSSVNPSPGLLRHVRSSGGGSGPDSRRWTGVGASPLPSRPVLGDRPIADRPVAGILPGRDRPILGDRPVAGNLPSVGRLPAIDPPNVARGRSSWSTGQSRPSE